MKLLNYKCFDDRQMQVCIRNQEYNVINENKKMRVLFVPFKRGPGRKSAQKDFLNIPLKWGFCRSRHKHPVPTTKSLKIFNSKKTRSHWSSLGKQTPWILFSFVYCKSLDKLIGEKSYEPRHVQLVGENYLRWPPKLLDIRLPLIMWSAMHHNPKAKKMS